MRLVSIVRYEVDGAVRIGRRAGDTITELDGVATLASLWQLPAADLRERLLDPRALTPGVPSPGAR